MIKNEITKKETIVKYLKLACVTIFVIIGGIYFFNLEEDIKRWTVMLFFIAWIHWNLNESIDKKLKEINIRLEHILKLLERE